MKKFIIIIIKIYQYTISPYMPTMCKFYPSCSNYSIKALSKYNIFIAFFFIFKRLLKCNPFFKGGYDPI